MQSRVRAGEDGCGRMYMGAVGCDNTSTQENKTKRDTMNKKMDHQGMISIHLWTCVQNRHVCVDGHKGTRGASGG